MHLMFLKVISALNYYIKVLLLRRTVLLFHNFGALLPAITLDPSHDIETAKLDYTYIHIPL